ncbi:diguanylate cyclase [Deinococcus sp.]|uniref:GGDEF domain-containing protein n=1 Tax=Deinococcus sp. TaxID=47478 RepID=UPI003B59D2F7
MLMPTPIPRLPSLNGPKRWAYLSIALCLCVLGAVNVGLLWRAPVGDPLAMALSGAVVLLGLGLIAGMFTASLERAERAALWLLALIFAGFNLRLLLTPAADPTDYSALLLVTLGAATALRLRPRYATPLILSMLGLHLFAHWWPFKWPLTADQLSNQLTHDLTLLSTLPLLGLLGVHRTAWFSARESALAMREMAMQDHLTGLPNRRAAYRRFDEAMRDLQTPVSVLLLDIDNFKHVNDTHGHEIGDQVIVEITGALKGALGKSGLLVRWGGEEYLALLSGTTLGHAVREGEAMRRAVADLTSPYGPLTISVGAASRVPRDTVQALIHRADQGLYRAKESGKNKVVAQED